jgi:hypothetical protein
MKSSCHVLFTPHGTLNWTRNSSGLFLAASGQCRKQFYCCVVQTTQKNTSHMITKHCWVVSSLHLHGSVFTEPLPRSWLHNPIPLLVRVLLRNSCFCGSTVLAWGKYATISTLTGVWKKLIPTLMHGWGVHDFSGGNNCRCGGNSKRTRIRSGGLKIWLIAAILW